MNKKTKHAQAATSPAIRPIDAPHVEPNRTSISIKKADNGGYVVNHHGVKSGSYYDKTHIAPSTKHLKKMVGKMAC